MIGIWNKKNKNNQNAFMHNILRAVGKFAAVVYDSHPTDSCQISCTVSYKWIIKLSRVTEESSLLSEKLLKGKKS